LRALLRVCKRFGKAWLMSNGTSADAVTPWSPPEVCALGPENTPVSIYCSVMSWGGGNTLSSLFAPIWSLVTLSIFSWLLVTKGKPLSKFVCRDSC
jgi:hypothetical protein